MAKRNIHITKEQIQEALDMFHPFKTKAAKHLNVSYDTFRRRAKEYNIYKPSHSINRKSRTKDFIQDCINNTSCMAEASRKSGLSYAAFKRHAVSYGLWKPTFTPNKGQKRVRKNKIQIKDLIEGKHPDVSSTYARHLIIKHNVLEMKCQICGITEWQGKPAPLQMDHINGDNTNHTLSNIRMLCPNCHAQTDTFCGRNIIKKYTNSFQDHTS